MKVFICTFCFKLVRSQPCTKATLTLWLERPTNKPVPVAAGRVGERQIWSPTATHDNGRGETKWNLFSCAPRPFHPSASEIKSFVHWPSPLLLAHTRSVSTQGQMPPHEPSTLIWFSNSLWKKFCLLKNCICGHELLHLLIVSMLEEWVSKAEISRKYDGDSVAIIEEASRLPGCRWFLAMHGPPGAGKDWQFILWNQNFNSLNILHDNKIFAQALSLMRMSFAWDSSSLDVSWAKVSAFFFEAAVVTALALTVLLSSWLETPPVPESPPTSSSSSVSVGSVQLLRNDVGPVLGISILRIDSERKDDSRVGIK